MQARWTITAVVLMLSSLPAAGGQLADSDQWSSSVWFRRFNDQVAAYITMRNDVQQRIGVPMATSDPNDIMKYQWAITTAIRNARPNARAGDFFNDVVAFDVRKRIHQVLKQHQVSSAELLLDLSADSTRPPAGLVVNEPFDWRFGAWMPAAMIDALPRVPYPLEYRFLAGDLLLLDVEAQLIVDVLPGALSGD